MAKDVSNKSLSNNNTDNSSPSISDQQKVPPLRIVLNTSGNQKSSSTTSIAVAPNQQTDIKRDKSQDAKSDSALKTGGRFRIKLGVNKQPVSKSGGAVLHEALNKSANEDAPKTKVSVEKQEKDDNNTTNYSHLRRITRRSNRTVQTVSNEDEESISSMTSTDENQTAVSNSNSDISAQDTVAGATSQTNATSTSSSSTSATTTTTTTTTAAPNSGPQETPRRYKRRKVETTECPLIEQDGLLSFQNYKLPTQNSFELYRNIRKQVDKKLKNLNSVHPRTPYGFRDYILTRGSYLLDGNKLGNGTNLFVGEDGGLHPAPMGKYHALRNNRVNYSVPNRAKVPLGLPVNSALYNLFIDQEKERFRMRMQHIKEREKLTLSAEQEIIRVYNQAAMAEANQLEPFSACTMLKHQEIYNYLDSDGSSVASNQNAQQDEANGDASQDSKRSQNQVSSPKQPSADEKEDCNTDTPSQKESVKSPEQTASTDAQKDEAPQDESKSKVVSETNCEKNKTKVAEKEEASRNSSPSSDKLEMDIDQQSSKTAIKKEVDLEKVEKDADESDTKEGEPKELVIDEKSANENEDSQDIKKEPNADEISQKDETDAKILKPDAQKIDTKISPDDLVVSNNDSTQKDEEPPVASSREATSEGETKNDQTVPTHHDNEAPQADPSVETELSDDDRRAHNKEIFLSQLQEIDDKWDKIRQETLVRHRNEAESLHAVQRLEWEWKTKEIGACDVRMTPIIDNTLVPKLYIYTHDY